MIRVSPRETATSRNTALIHLLMDLKPRIGARTLWRHIYIYRSFLTIVTLGDSLLSLSFPFCHSHSLRPHLLPYSYLCFFDLPSYDSLILHITCTATLDYVQLLRHILVHLEHIEPSISYTERLYPSDFYRRLS